MPFIKRKSITTILLFIVGFIFLHSEFGLLAPEGHSHQTHDYCQLVNNVTNQIQKTVNSILFKPTVNKDICFHCFEETSSNTEKTLSITFKFDLIKYSFRKEIFTKNCSFLI